MKYRSKQKQRRKVQKVSHLVLLCLLGLCLVFFGLWYLLNQEALVINHVEVNGTSHIDPQAVKSLVSDHIASRHLLGVPDGSTAFTNESAIEALIMQNYPAAESVEAEVSMTKRSLFIGIDEYEPAYIVCPEIGQDCLWANPESVVFRAADSDDLDHESFFIVPSPRDRQPELREAVLEKEHQVLISQLRQFFQLRDLHIASMTFQSDFWLTVESKAGSLIFLNPDDSAEKIMGRLRQAFDESAFSIDESSGEFSRPIVYVNFRHGQKVFYCLEGDECATNY